MSKTTSATAPPAEASETRLVRRLKAVVEKNSIGYFGQAAGIHPVNIAEILAGREPNDIEKRRIEDTIKKMS